MKVDNNTYVFSDPHYGHRNLVRGITSWIGQRGCRDFDTLEEHNDTIVSNINKTVPENATLICLGDLSFGGIENIWNFRKRINCKDIHLILGNHDHHIENDKILPNCHYEGLFPDGNIIDGNGDEHSHSVTAQDLFTSVSHYKEISFKKEGCRYDIILFHYAMRVWNKANRGSIHLYGHSHGNLSDDNGYGRSMDVGLDTNNLYPYHIEEIIDIMKERPVGFEIDHHCSTDGVDTKNDIGVFGKPKGV